MAISKERNDQDMKKLKEGIDKTYDLFIHGGPGIKPGAIETYGALCGLKEVYEERKTLAKGLSEPQPGEE